MILNFNKTKLICFCVVIVLIVFAGIGFYKYDNSKLDRERYLISSPMMDYEYKKNIIETSGNKRYKLENLRPIVGPEELIEFLNTNTNNSKIYTPSVLNVKNGEFRANLHMHTVFSDGEAKVQQLLDIAQEYAENNLNGADMYMAITDHNTVLGTKELIKVLQKYPNRYDKVKVVAGIEIFTEYNNSKVSPKPIEIHVLTMAINPYDEFLNKEFIKKNRKDKWNRTYPDRDFDWVIKTMKEYGVVGIAHPARYTSFLKDLKYDYIKELMARFRVLAGEKTIFTEGYYQVYSVLPDKSELADQFDRYIKHINKEAQIRNILLDGSTDVHNVTIFSK